MDKENRVKQRLVELYEEADKTVGEWAKFDAQTLGYLVGIYNEIEALEEEIDDFEGEN